MELKDLSFVPYSDTGADEIEIIKEHDNFIKSKKYNEATTLLESEQLNKGVRASILNSIQNKIRQLQLYLLNEFVADQDTYYSDTEPSAEFMDEHGYKFWSKPY